MNGQRKDCGNEWSETFTFDPGVVVQSGDVYVIASNSADKTVLNSSDATYVYADPWYVTSFNGDDGRALARATDPENNIIDIIGTLDIGVQALGTMPVRSEKKNQGEVGVDISFGGLTFQSGDYVYADNNG